MFIGLIINLQTIKVNSDVVKDIIFISDISNLHHTYRSFYISKHAF